VRLDRSILAGAVLAASAASTLIAADGNGSYAVEGPGRMTCADFAALSPDEPRARDVAVWLSGYMTAHNRLLTGTFDLTPWQTPGTLTGLLAQFCADNGDEVVETGATELVNYLADGRLRDRADAVAVKHDGKVTMIYAPLLAEVHARLAATGYPSEGPDKLPEALQGYQKANGLTPTGLPDQPTLLKLMAR
jgi:hypothetical protein